MVQLERRFLNIRNDEDRPAGIEQSAFDNDLLDRVGFRLRLPDNGEIETPRDLAELVAGADQACADRQRLGLNARARTCRCEAFPSSFDRGLVMPFNHFQFWGNVAGARNRHDRCRKGKRFPSGGLLMPQRPKWSSRLAEFALAPIFRLTTMSLIIAARPPVEWR